MPPRPSHLSTLTHSLTHTTPSTIAAVCVSSTHQVDLAVREVQNIIDAGLAAASGGGGGGFMSAGAGNAAVIVQVPNERVGLIIGRQGATIKDLQNRTGARIQVRTSGGAHSH
jgi:predicted PilT family ATPase